MSVCACEYAYATCMRGCQRTSSAPGSPLPSPCRSQELNSGHQTWWQVPLLDELSHCPPPIFLKIPFLCYTVGEFECGMKRLSSPFKKYSVPPLENLALGNSHGHVLSWGWHCFKLAWTSYSSSDSNLLCAWRPREGIGPCRRPWLALPSGVPASLRWLSCQLRHWLAPQPGKAASTRELFNLLGLFQASFPFLCWVVASGSPVGHLVAGRWQCAPGSPLSLPCSLFLHNLSMTWLCHLSSVKLVFSHPWNYIHLGNISSY